MLIGPYLIFGGQKFFGNPIYKPTNSRRIKNKRRKAHIMRTTKNQNTRKHWQYNK